MENPIDLKALEPGTKILAIGSLDTPLSPEDMKSILPGEVKKTVELYLKGKIEQWWFRKDGNGTVFLMNVATTEEASTLLEALPLGVAKKMKYELLPVGPLSPLHVLIGEHSAG